MSNTIVVQGTPIDFPSSAQDPNWAPPVIQFAETVADALEGIVGQADISPQNFIIDGAGFNPTPSPENIPGLQFSTAIVRSAQIRYSVYRTATAPTTTAYEAGTITIIYNPSNSVTEKWELSRQYVGDAQIDFSITDTGQLQFETTQIGTTNHVGTIGFAAQAILYQT
jgi:hypothetical protein